MAARSLYPPVPRAKSMSIRLHEGELEDLERLRDLLVRTPGRGALSWAEGNRLRGLADYRNGQNTRGRVSSAHAIAVAIRYALEQLDPDAGEQT